MSNPLEEWEYLHEKGFPIKNHISQPHVWKGSLLNREVTHIERQSLADTLFQPPMDLHTPEDPPTGNDDS